MHNLLNRNMASRNKIEWVKTDEDVLQIRWKKSDYIDLIRADEFDPPVCENVSGSHSLCLPDGTDRSRAKFLKTLRAKTAVFDYGNDRVIEVNKMRKLDIGVMRITFIDNERSSVQEVHWTDEGGREYSNAASTSWDLRPELDDELVLPEEDDIPRETTSRKDRRLQTRFRCVLLQVYENTCCVSQCSITPTLEAAHIVPSSSPRSFDPRNGLLLRADLHRLFDKNMLGIDPDSRTVRLHKALANSKEYGHFNGGKIREPKPRSYRPIDEALQRKWRHFDITTSMR